MKFYGYSFLSKKKEMRHFCRNIKLAYYVFLTEFPKEVSHLKERKGRQPSE